MSSSIDKFNQSSKNTDRVIIFDTTLRDGEQSPGFSMTRAEKITMAIQLERLGVDVIEAGFPVSSPGDWQSVNEIAKTVKNAKIAGLARSKKGDIDAAASAIEPASQKRIHTFISTSDLHMAAKLQMDRDRVLEEISQSVRYARNFTDDVEWSAEDASRTDLDFLCRCVDAAIHAGATTINLPDTVGYAMPHDYAHMFNHVITAVTNSDKAVFSVHCHNDLGMAVANTLAGVHAGARQIECTINGIGERAGNAALEEIVMAIKTRRDVNPFRMHINTQEIMRTSQCLEHITGVGVQPNKAIVGKNAFAHEAGIHQDGMLKDRMTYEIMTPESVGVVGSSLVIGKHSGRNAVDDKLKQLGFADIGKDVLQGVFNEVKTFADEYKIVPDEQIVAIAQQFRLRRQAAPI